MLFDLFSALGVSLLINLSIFLLAYSLKTDKLTDISYSLTIFAINLYGYLVGDMQATDTVIAVLISIWALRLGSYLFYRISVIGKDDRFNDIKENFVSFLSFWIMQGITCMLILTPALIIYRLKITISPWLLSIGLLLAILGLVIETIADSQKFSFKRKNPTQFISHGLWKTLRHPNYTGELMFWWGIFIASFTLEYYYIALLGPIWISIIILKFSGIPPLDKKWKKNYGNDPAFQKYYQKSYRLIPYLY